MTNYTEADLFNFGQLKFLQNYLFGHKGFVAGGCFKNILQGEHVKDIDIFFRNREEHHEALKLFESMVRKQDNWKQAYKSDKVDAFTDTKHDLTVELIKSRFGSPDVMLDDFDFTICKMALSVESVPPEDDGDDWNSESRLIHHPNFFEHLFMKRLVADEVNTPVSTFHRMIKYISYGYKPCRETRFKLLGAISVLNTNDIADSDLGSFYDGID